MLLTRYGLRITNQHHTNNMLDYDESFKRKDYRNLNDLENERSQISYKLSDTDQKSKDRCI